MGEQKQGAGFDCLSDVIGLYVDKGVLERADKVPPHMALFIEQSARVLGKAAALQASGAMTQRDFGHFRNLLVEVGRRIINHPIVRENRYLERFSEGVTKEQAAHELQQFSVFSEQFNAAQASLIANARTEESREERLKLLLNEYGIPYKDGFSGELTGKWSRASNHFEWLRTTAEGLGLGFKDIGQMALAKEGAQRFVSALFNYYASSDPNLSEGAAFGIENWAANKLWKPWIEGMERLNETLPEKVVLSYMRYHDMEEEHHSQATLDELLENFMESWFDAKRFLEGAELMLEEGVRAYYEGQLETLPGRDATWPAAVCG